jgi:hypothetical protein
LIGCDNSKNIFIFNMKAFSLDYSLPLSGVSRPNTAQLLALNQNVGRMGMPERLQYVLGQAAWRTPGALGDTLRSLAQPQNLAMMVGGMAVIAGLNMTGWGNVATVLAIGGGLLATGTNGWRGLVALKKAYDLMSRASTTQELDAAGAQVAEAAIALGSAAIFGLLTRQAVAVARPPLVATGESGSAPAAGMLGGFRPGASFRIESLGDLLALAKAVNRGGPRGLVARTDNCVPCAVAFEQSLRKGVVIPSQDVPMGVNLYMADAARALGGNQLPTSMLSRPQLQQLINSLPPGARGIVSVQGAGEGHAINVLRTGSGVHLIDAQLGTKGSLDGGRGFIFLRTN